uniref:LysR substrate-binding domain-containing protein n=1 Tax=Pseudomonas fluorescens TaxID=294 RepID=UPI00214CC4F7|nr:LysR substrate-binding domain-containing protein [Pseudomonas fluorescens]
MALADRGITYCLEERVSDYLAPGELQIVLPDWAPIEPAFYIYYPGRRHMPLGLRELVDLFQANLSS